MYGLGMVVKKDLELANYYVKLAANQNFSYSNGFLGYYYRTGKGGEQNYEKARFHYEAASKQFNSNSICEIGSLYNNGEGVEVDLSKAIEYYLLVIKIYEEKKLEVHSRKFFFTSSPLKFYPSYYFAYNNLAVISIIEPFYYNIIRAGQYFKTIGLGEFSFGQCNYGLFLQLFLDQKERAERIFEISSQKKFCLAFYNLDFLHETAGKKEESIKYYTKAIENEENDIFIYGKPKFDHRLQISKIFILCLANLKLCLHNLKNKYLMENAKYFFVHAFSQLEIKFKQYKFVLGIKNNSEYKFNFQINKEINKNSFLYLRSYIFNYPLFNLREQKNLNLSDIYHSLSHFPTIIPKIQNIDDIEKQSNDKNIKFEFKDEKVLKYNLINEVTTEGNDNFGSIEYLFSTSWRSDELKDYLIQEIEYIVNHMEKILYTPPYQILFGRIWLNHSKEKNIGINNINQVFYEGFGDV